MQWRALTHTCLSCSRHLEGVMAMESRWNMNDIKQHGLCGLVLVWGSEKRATVT